MSAADGLSADERRRLAAFASAFDRLDASMYASLADRGEPAVAAAKADALDRLGDPRRRQAVRAAVTAFIDEATVAYSRRMTLTDTLMLFQSLPDRAEDRVRFLASLERAVVAVVLWDELSASDRDALLGPWANVLPPSLRQGPD
ncbi:MAG TPA: hypothetical protein VJ506_11850 [Candidatus Limnocylindrales bacterium]|nr:hypothetical protein [Candidatus Limnocylindrales bacterium]